MKMIFDRNLENMLIYAQGREVYKYFETNEPEHFVHSFPNPIVPTDFYRAVTTIHDSSVRDMVCALLSSAQRDIEYDGTTVDWYTHGLANVWHPTIDTFLFCKALHEIPIIGTEKTCVEIGCGSGFISKYVLEHLPNIERMDVVDTEHNAIVCAKKEITDIRAHFYIQNGISFLNNKKYDLILTNPPYIPRPNTKDRNPYEGTEIVEYMIFAEKHLNHNGKILMNTSHLCEHIVQKCTLTSKLQRRIVSSLEVPFRVRAVLRNPTWLDYLQQECGLRKECKNGYDYWHTLQVSVFELPRS